MLFLSKFCFPVNKDKSMVDKIDTEVKKWSKVSRGHRAGLDDKAEISIAQQRNRVIIMLMIAVVFFIAIVLMSISFS